jgi:hypothetical protein
VILTGDCILLGKLSSLNNINPINESKPESPAAQRFYRSHCLHLSCIGNQSWFQAMTVNRLKDTLVGPSKHSDGTQLTRETLVAFSKTKATLRPYV